MTDTEQRAAPVSETKPPRSVGTLLREARMARDLSLEQASTELRIEAAQLDALERDRFDRIGVPVFVKGYLKQYGTFLGLDHREVLAQYHKQDALKEVEIQPSKTITLRDERQITVWVVAAVLLAALAAALGYWWYSGAAIPGVSPPAAAPETSTAPAGATSEPAAAVSNVTRSAAAAAVPPADPSAASALAAVSTSAASSPATSATATDVTVTPVSAAPPQASLVEPAGAAGVQSAAESEPAPSEIGGRPSSALELAFEQESWAEISDARGQRLFYGMGAAGRNATLSGEPPFAVVLGNSAGVKMKLDGDDYVVPTSGKPGDYARFSVNVVSD
jgi:cytoskeleton protein RodZ